MRKCLLLWELCWDSNHIHQDMNGFGNIHLFFDDAYLQQLSFLFLCTEDRQYSLDFDRWVGLLLSIIPKIVREVTNQLGWDRWISVFPYLWLEPNFDWSMNESLLTLNPVEAKPVLFWSNFSRSRDLLERGVIPLAYILSDRTDGRKPWYPGIVPLFGTFEFFL